MPSKLESKNEKQDEKVSKEGRRVRRAGWLVEYSLRQRGSTLLVL